jgi:hypothetical protein
VNALAAALLFAASVTMSLSACGIAVSCARRGVDKGARRDIAAAGILGIVLAACAAALIGGALL